MSKEQVTSTNTQPITVDRRVIDQDQLFDVNSTLNKDIEEGMEIIATLLCSSVRSAHSPSTRVNGLILMQKLADHGTNYTRLQRLVPYTCALLSDSSGLVKSTAIRTLTYVLTKVNDIQ